MIGATIPGRCRPIEEVLAPSVRRQEFRKIICDSVRSLDASDREQLLVELVSGVLLLEDNVKIFPGQRLARLARQVRDGDSRTLAQIDGIAHFHPDATAQPSRDDLMSFEGFTRELAKWGRRGLWWVVVAYGEIDQLLRAADTGLDAFHALLDGPTRIATWQMYSSG
jgi:hypothetical protein